MQTLADVVYSHICRKEISSRQLSLRCPMCVNPVCGKMRDFFADQKLV